MPKCKCCKKKLDNTDGVIVNLSRFCGYDCAVKWSLNDVKETKHKEQKKKDKVRLEELKTASDYVKEAQAAVNAWVRWRDRDKPCISCDSFPTNDGLIKGQRVDAGHYRSRGAAGHLRFNLSNIHKQCVRCNRNLSGNVVEYRIRLIERSGLERVEALETDNKPRKFDVEYLRRIKRIFAKRLRQAKKRNEA